MKEWMLPTFYQSVEDLGLPEDILEGIEAVELAFADIDPLDQDAIDKRAYEVMAAIENGTFL